MEIMTPKTEEMKVIAALKKLEKNWPKNLWVFCNGQSFTLLELGENGERVMNDVGSVDPDYIVATFNIPNDGGDW